MTLIGAFGVRVGLRSAPAAASNDQPSGSEASSTERVHAEVLEPVAVRAIWMDSVAPGEIRIGSSGGSMRATYGSTMVKSTVALLLSFLDSVRLLFTSRRSVNSCSPSSAVKVALKVRGPPSPLGDTGSASAKRSLAISFPFIRRTASTFS